MHHATYFESHGVDNATGLSYAMHLTPLMNDASLTPANFAQGFVQRMPQEIQERVGRMG